MKKYFLSLALLFAVMTVEAQWTLNSNDLYPNNNSWSVGIGNSAPGYKLDVTGDINGSRYYIGGQNALYAPATGNLFAGASSGAAWASGANYNACFGVQSGPAISSGDYNAFFGAYSGYPNNGSYNVMVGEASGFSSTASISYCTFAGTFAGYANTQSECTLIGCRAGYNNAGGSATHVGFEAGYNNTGSGATFVGYKAGHSNTSGNSNTFLGDSTGYTNSTGTENTFLGARAGYNTDAAHNTFVGRDAGYNNVNGINNVFLGFQADCPTSTTYDASIALGAYSQITASNQMMVGSSASAPINQVLFPNASDFQINGGVTGTYTFEVNGSAAGTSNWVGSDRKWKKDITPITHALDKVMQMEGVSYEWRTDEFPEINFKSDPGRHTGFIAQDMKKIVPEAVRADDKGNHMMCYDALVPVLVEAMKEQQHLIDSLSAAIQKNSLESTADAARNVHSIDLGSNVVLLEQNAPNPFAETTVINYTIPAGSKIAQIVFHDNSGKLVRAVEIEETGKGSLRVFAGNLGSGMYTYSLIIDGKTVDTKKMVVEK